MKFLLQAATAALLVAGSSGGRSARVHIDGKYHKNGPARLYFLPGYFNKTVTDAAVAFGEDGNLFKRSQVMSSDGDTKRDIRTSSSAYIANNDLPPILLDAVHDMHLEAAFPFDQGEDLQLTRYVPGEKYEFHWDSSMELGRAVTVLVYLQDVEEGGYTIFPKARVRRNAKRLKQLTELTGVEFPPSRDPSWDAELPELGLWHDDPQPPMQPFCDHPGVLKFKPRAGDMLLWYSHDGENDIDWQTLHGGCPPTVDGRVPEGDEALAMANNEETRKYIMQRWIRWYEPGTANEFHRLLDQCGIFADW